jgi:dephospho-CoA kinase
VLSVAVTGGIGAGKSSVARLLAQHGAVVLDADAEAREVVAPGTSGLAALIAEFGPGIVSGGRLDRARLAERIFSHPADRKRLNAIIHPLVHERLAIQRAAAPPDAIVVTDIPLLVETGTAHGHDVVVAVEAPYGVRVARLMNRRGMDRADIEARLVAQAKDEDRRDVAHLVVDNGGTEAELAAAVGILWHSLVARNKPGGTE